MVWFVIYAEGVGEGRVKVGWKEVESLKDIDEEKAVMIYKKEEIGEETIALMKALVETAKEGIWFQKVTLSFVPKGEVS